ncbi:MAG TPA: ABC transporter ATP-binding protein [Clostridiales bacterium]|nr:ABC transporter ATP-binding protein [Clostridiales bacterium]
MLTVENLTVRYGDLTIVDRVSFTVEAGEWLMIVGPNGAGKTTVIHAIAQSAPYTGSVRFAERDIRHCRPRELARNIGVLAQNHYMGYAFTVEEVVRLGRYAYTPRFLWGSADTESDKIQLALKKTGMEPFLKHSVLTLSGGELQRTFLAQLFAQDPRLLLLDEPTNHLDLIYQKQTFEPIREWLKETGRAVISVVHDLSLARAYGTHALLMDRGQITAMGKTAEVMSPKNLNKVYDMDVYGWMRDIYSRWESEQDHQTGKI